MPFQGSFHNCIENALPSYVHFAYMIEHGADRQYQLKCDASKTYLYPASIFKFYNTTLSNDTSALVQLLCKMHRP